MQDRSRRQEAMQAMREGEWAKAASLLADLAENSEDPLLINDLATAYHQAGNTQQAIKLLKELQKKKDLPAIVRLNLMYMQKAHEILSDFDPAWEHKDHDGTQCPEDPPLVSVIVRTYNRPDLLKNALQSLAEQTLQDFEVIVINDGGDPACEHKAKESKIKNLRYYYMPHGGRVRALNAGLEMAHGKYVTGLDDDDIAFPDHLDKLISCLNSQDSAPVCYADYRVVEYKKGRKGELERTVEKEIRVKDYYDGLFFNTNPATIQLMARKECYRHVGKFNPELELGEDWEMWLRLAEKYDFRHLPEVTAEVRERPGDANITNRRLRRKYYWDNIVLYMHRSIVLLSEPESPAATAKYKMALNMLDRAVQDSPGIDTLLNLRGLWNTKKTYRWFADQARWFIQIGEYTFAKDFYRAAMRLSPFQPKLWAGFLKAFIKEKR